MARKRVLITGAAGYLSRQLLPVFKDMLEGFELKLRLEIYDAKQWASTTRGHQSWGGPNGVSVTAGRQTIYHLTDKHLRAADHHSCSCL